jgi:hypothetical protein
MLLSRFRLGTIATVRVPSPGSASANRQPRFLYFANVSRPGQLDAVLATVKARAGSGNDSAERSRRLASTFAALGILSFARVGTGRLGNVPIWQRAVPGLCFVPRLQSGDERNHDLCGLVVLFGHRRHVDWDRLLRQWALHENRDNDRMAEGNPSGNQIATGGRNTPEPG